MLDKIGGGNPRVFPLTTMLVTPPTQRSAARPVQDQATLSDRARELSLARSAISQAPDVRTERVEMLRQRVEAGTYYVPDSLLAQKILDFHA